MSDALRKWIGRARNDYATPDAHIAEALDLLTAALAVVEAAEVHIGACRACRRRMKGPVAAFRALEKDVVGE